LIPYGSWLTRQAGIVIVGEWLGSICDATDSGAT
jgi:hypothetical protein